MGREFSDYLHPEFIPPSPELKLIYPSEKFSVDNVPIEFHHTVHDIKNIQENRDFFEQAIKDASVVVLEVAPRAEGTYNLEYQKAICQAAQAAGSNLTLEELQTELNDNRILQFYDELEKLAAKYGKPIVTLDPTFREDREILKARSVILGIEKAAVLGGAAIGLAGKFVLSKIIKREKPPEEENNPKETDVNLQSEKPKGLSRRQILKFGLGAAAGLATSSLLSTHGLGRITNTDKEGRATPVVGATAFDVGDYRDTVIAEGLHMLAKNVPDKTNAKVVAFYGPSHGKPVNIYENNVNERRLRKKLYSLTLARGINPKLRLYKYKDNAWSKEIEQNIIN